MSFISTNAFYQEEIILLDKDFEAPTPITEGQVINGNLQPFSARIKLTNTGNELQNSGIITLRIPPDGTFVRKEPILINEGAKDNYIIQARIKQDRDKDGVYEEEGRLFRFFIGQPTLIDDALTGETLKITLISTEYHTRETLDSERITFPFKTPQEAFVRRITAYNTIKGETNTQLIHPVGINETIKLPDAESLSQEFRPLVLTSTHDLFGIIAKSQSLPSIAGGVFRDFFFDYEPLVLSIKAAKIRPEWDATTQYYDGTLGTNQSEVRILDPFLDEIRFFKAIQTTGNINRNPTTDPLKEAYWEEDFVTIPDYNKYASYKKDDIIVQPDSGPSPVDRFYKAIQDVPNNPTNLSIYKPAPFGTSYWADTGQTFLRGLNHPLFDSNAITIGRGGRTRFFSYTPWTADFEAMRAGTLFGIGDNQQEDNFETAGYQGVVPDWNYVRANFDRIEADNQYEQVVGKDVIKTLDAPPPDKECYLGARYLVSENPTGIFSGQDNKIAEYVGPDFNPNDSVSDWEFSKSPEHGEVICHQATGVMLVWKNDTNQWEKFWNVLDIAPGGVDNSIWQQIVNGLTTVGVFFIVTALGPIVGTAISFLFDIQTFGSATRQSPLHICKDIKLVEGASGIPGQAFELRFDWNPLESNFHFTGETGGDKKNYTSLGAWWFMQFPYIHHQHLL